MHGSDLQLLRRFSLRGDQEAFAEIVRRYAGLVFSTGYRILADRARAEEVAQETFLRLAQRPHAVSRSLGGWLHRSAMQFAIDEHRSDRARRRRETASAEEAQRHRAESAAQEEPREAASWAEISPLVDSALDELPAEARELLVEHFLEGRTQQAMAHERGTSPATICRQMKAAVELLAAKLKDKGLCAAGATLALWLTDHATQAAPPALLRELGKLSMVSPVVRRLHPDPWAEAKKLAARCALVALVMVLLALVTWPVARYVRFQAHPPTVPTTMERE